MESQAYGDKTNISPLRALVSNGDSFLGTVAVSSLTKIVLKSRALYGTNSTLTKQRQLVMLAVCCGVADLIERSTSEKHRRLALQICEFYPPIFPGASADCIERLALFARLILDTEIQAATVEAYLSDSKISFSQYLRHASNSTLVVEPSSKNLSTPALAQSR